jgi:hypothetical protein
LLNFPNKKVSHIFVVNFLEKSPFLTIKLYVEFGFDHPIQKPDIFDHLTFKTIMFGHRVVLQSGFADVDAMWRWGHLSAPPLFPLSPLYLPLFSLYPAANHVPLPPTTSVTAIVGPHLPSSGELLRWHRVGGPKIVWSPRTQE